MSFIQSKQVDLNDILELLNPPLRKQKNLLINSTIKIKEIYYNIQLQQQHLQQLQQQYEREENENKNKRDSLSTFHYSHIPIVSSSTSLLSSSSTTTSSSSTSTTIDNYSIEDVIG